MVSSSTVSDRPIVIFAVFEGFPKIKLPAFWMSMYEVLNPDTLFSVKKLSPRDLRVTSPAVFIAEVDSKNILSEMMVRLALLVAERLPVPNWAPLK